MQFDVHPVRRFEHCGFVLPRKDSEKRWKSSTQNQDPKRRPQFTTKNVGTHSGCPHCWRSFVSNFGPRNGAHVSGTGAGPRKERYQTQGRREICPGMPMFSDSGHNASHMVLLTFLVIMSISNVFLPVCRCCLLFMCRRVHLGRVVTHRTHWTIRMMG